MTAYIQMKREDATKWLAALRSGEYKQTKRMLARLEEDGTESFCCLGVLQKVLDGDVERVQSCAIGVPTMGWLERHGIVFLDVDLNACHVPYIESVHQYASVLNDEGGLTFAEIADLLEAEILPTD